jgi:hypothetical protein
VEACLAQVLLQPQCNRKKNRSVGGGFCLGFADIAEPLAKITAAGGIYDLTTAKVSVTAIGSSPTLLRPGCVDLSSRHRCIRN